MPGLPKPAEVRPLWEHLPQDLIDHLERVSRLSGELATRWGVDPEAAELAGFLHDIARAQRPDELLRQARDLGLPIDPVEQATPLLLHGPVGAALARAAVTGAGDDVFQAITWHSTARPGMSHLEQVVFLADKLDPGKAGYYPPGLEPLGQLAQAGLDQAVVFYLDWQLRQLLERGSVVHPAAVHARNWLLLRPHGDKLTADL
ncbi:MAG: HD domain-containing protein [Dehalococcoidia bacterium]|nr:HD domain-containing protein [Dehalococcoidia bacterium]